MLDNYGYVVIGSMKVNPKQNYLMMAHISKFLFLHSIFKSSRYLILQLSLIQIENLNHLMFFYFQS